MILFVFIFIIILKQHITYSILGTELSFPLPGLNKDFKRMLNEHAELKALQLKDMRTASDGTRKVKTSFQLFLEIFQFWLHTKLLLYAWSLWELSHSFGSHRRLQILFTLEDGLVIETVVIPCERGRNTVCVSSQVGCAMNCQFCYTGRQDMFSSLHRDNFQSLDRKWLEFSAASVFLCLLDSNSGGMWCFVVQDGIKKKLVCCWDSGAGSFCKAPGFPWCRGYN